MPRHRRSPVPAAPGVSPTHAGASPGDGTPLAAPLDLRPEEAGDDRRLRIAVAVAVVFHALLLVLPAPRGQAAQAEAEEPRQLVVVQQVRFKPPEVPPEQIPQQQRTKVPIPDPTPDDPEPIRPLADLQPDVPDLPGLDPVIDIPDGPPPLPDDGPLVVGGEIARPRGLHNPEPRYTEIARKARIEGTVILQLTLNRGGEVEDVKVLKGLPMGLTESSVEAVRTWRYEPALLNGKPVPVYMVVTVQFGLG